MLNIPTNAKIIISLTLMSLLSLPLVTCAALNDFNVSPPDNADYANVTSGDKLIISIIGIVLAVIGALTIAVIIYGGIRIVVAADPENRKKGYQMVGYALVGLVLVLLSFAITNALGHSLTDAITKSN